MRPNRSKQSKTSSVARIELAKDVLLILIGAAVAIALAHTGAIEWFTRMLGGGVVSSFISGIFFTSVFTIAPAAIALVHISQTTSIATIAFVGALGAMCGDLILFFFIRDRFADDLAHSFKPSFLKHIARSFHFGFLKWLSPVLGALIIASPLPDEFGLTLMGLSKTRVIILAPISFVMNIAGIYSIIWFAHIL